MAMSSTEPLEVRRAAQATAAARLHMIVFSAAHAGQIEPFFASLANPTLKSRDSTICKADTTIRRLDGLSTRMCWSAPGREAWDAICLHTVGMTR